MKRYTFRYYLGRVDYEYTTEAETRRSAWDEFMDYLSSIDISKGCQIILE